MKSDLIDCMHSGELLLGASVLLVLLIIAGSVTVLLIGHLRGSPRRRQEQARNAESDV